MNSELKNRLGPIIQILLIGFAILILMVAINYLRPNAAQPGQSVGYPYPDQANINLAPTEIPYPGPYWNTPTSQPTPTCCYGLPT